MIQRQIINEDYLKPREWRDMIHVLDPILLGFRALVMMMILLIKILLTPERHFATYGQFGLFHPICYICLLNAFKYFIRKG